MFRISSTHIGRTAWIICVGALLSVISHAEPNLKALIITGQNNHHWEISTPILKRILENTGLFQVDVAQSPPQGGDFSQFRPEFHNYHVIVLDYNGDPWPEPVRNDFVQYVENGGGVVVYHAANNAFGDWQEFNKIIGLGGWGNRNEQSGPYLRWRDGQVIKEQLPGPSGAHGIQHAFQVVIRDTEHPITKGLPPVWMHAKDELYSHLRGPAENITLLATAYSDPNTKGSGEHEPILFTIQYGKGRIFHTVLGHAQEDIPVALQCAGFVTTLQRGAEWCATGNVTQPVPEDFPGPHEVRLWEEYRHIPFAEWLNRIKNYRLNDSRANITQINEYLRVITSGNRSTSNCENAMIQFLQSDATNEAKAYICTKLAEIGTELSVPILATLTGNPELVEYARFALEKIPGPLSTEVLLQSLHKVDAKAKVGFINSLGLRKEIKAIPTLATLLTDVNEEVAIASASALVEISTEEALRALVTVWECGRCTSELVQQKVTEMILVCAENLLKKRPSMTALDVVRRINSDNAQPTPIRIASLRILIQCSQIEGVNSLLRAMNDNNLDLATSVVRLFPLVTNKNYFDLICEEVSKKSPEYQLLAIQSFASNRLTLALPFIVGNLNNPEPAIRQACIKALEVVGDESCVPMLIEKALAENEEAELAKTVLANMNGEPIGVALLNQLKNANEDARLKKLLIPLVSARRVSGSEEIILRSASDADLECRLSALRSLVEAPKREMFDTIVQLAKNATVEEEQNLIEELLVRIIKLEAENIDKYVDKIILESNAIQELTPQKIFYRILARSGSIKGLEKIQSTIQSNTNPDLTVIAISALKEWNDDTPVEFILSIVNNLSDSNHKNIALETALSLTQKSTKSDEEIVQSFTKLLELNPPVGIKKSAIEKIAQRKIPQSLPMLLQYLQNSETEVQETLIRSLAGWKTSEPITPLMNLAKSTDNESLRRQALAGMIQIADNSTDLSDAQKVSIIHEAVSIASTPETLKGVIGALQNTNIPESLDIVTGYLQNEAVRGEAEVATVKLSRTLVGIVPDKVKQALETVIAQTQMDLIKEEAQRILDITSKFEDFITAWQVSGPYVNPEINPNMLYEYQFPPELPDAGPVTWRTVSPGTDPNRPIVIQLHKILGGENRVAYLRTFVWSDEEQVAQLRIGSDDGCRVWVNDTRVFGRNVDRACVPDDDIIEIKLKQGWNKILAKVRQGGGNWEFCARIRKQDGSPFDPPLRISISPQ